MLNGIELEGSKLVARHRLLHEIQESVTKKSGLQKDLRDAPAA